MTSIPARTALFSIGKVVGVLFAILVVVFWASDSITLQGERTLFGVNCEQGEWQGTHCAGKLVPGKRYAFRASTTRQEVAYWVRGSKEPSGKYTHCHVVNRDNWQCELQAGEAPGVTRELEDGRPAPSASPTSDAIHGVSKWKWYGVGFGIPWVTDADY